MSTQLSPSTSLAPRTVGCELFHGHCSPLLHLNRKEQHHLHVPNGETEAQSFSDVPKMTQTLYSRINRDHWHPGLTPFLLEPPLPRTWVTHQTYARGRVADNGNVSLVLAFLEGRMHKEEPNSSTNRAAAFLYSTLETCIWICPKYSSVLTSNLFSIVTCRSQPLSPSSCLAFNMLCLLPQDKEAI